MSRLAIGRPHTSGTRFIVSSHEPKKQSTTMAAAKGAAITQNDCRQEPSELEADTVEMSRAVSPNWIAARKTNVIAAPSNTSVTPGTVWLYLVFLCALREGCMARNIPLVRWKINISV